VRPELLALAILLAGCTMAGVDFWAHPQGDEAQLRADYAECRRLSRQIYPTWIGDESMIRPRMRMDAECMIERGHKPARWP
jgi:hypothetical protein